MLEAQGPWAWKGVSAPVRPPHPPLHHEGHPPFRLPAWGRTTCATSTPSLYLSLVAQNRHKLRSFDPTRGNRFSSWIGLLAINCAYDYLRSMKREPHRGSLSEASELACELPDPYENAVESQRAALAGRVLEEFSEKDQAFATLYFGEELDPVEIAARMNISVKTVYSKKHKIQSRLESVLTATGEVAA